MWQLTLTATGDQPVSQIHIIAEKARSRLVVISMHHAQSSTAEMHYLPRPPPLLLPTPSKRQVGGSPSPAPPPLLPPPRAISGKPAAGSAANWPGR